MDGDDTYCQAPQLKRGWELWVGDGWVTITSVRVSGEHVLAGAADGRTYRAGYLDAVRYRRSRQHLSHLDHSQKPQSPR